MARVLITGISGFTGRYVAQALAERGQEVVGMVRSLDEGGVLGASGLVEGDLGDPESLERVIDETRPDRVVHLAAISFVAHGDSNELYRTNLLGTVNLLQALAQTSCGRNGILIASSANVYGDQGGQLKEDTLPLPANHYGITKFATEHVARITSTRLPIIVVRPFNYTGVGQSLNFIIPKIIDHARRGVPDIELGNIDVARDFSDVRMVAQCYARLLDCPSAIGQTFNVCRGTSTRLREVIAIIEDLAGMSFVIRTNPAFVRESEIMDLYGCRDRLTATIGQIDMLDLRDTLAWMLRA